MPGPDKRQKAAARILSHRKLKSAFDNAWQVHARMFGEIMEPAFADDPAARIELVAILNHMTANDYGRAMKKLRHLRKFCVNDADLTAWFFFMGVCFGRMGLKERSCLMLSEACRLEPDFYMAYLLFAKGMHEDKHYEIALSSYISALERVQARPKRDEIPAVRTEPLLGSLHGNMASCFLMMRQYAEAEYELYEAESFGYDPPMLTLTWAMLFAATDRKAQAREKMALLRDKLPEAERHTVLSVEEIISGKNPHFALKKIDVPRLEAFWAWFASRERQIRTAVKSGFLPLAIRELEPKLYETFGYKDESVLFSFSKDADKLCLSFYDNYSLTNEIWLDKLLALTPPELKAHWSFYAVH